MAIPALNRAPLAVLAARRLSLRLLRSETGTTAIEYGLIAGLISIAIIAGATVVGSTLADYFLGFGDYF
jgi:pilus assembly protein Flp/PilA